METSKTSENSEILKSRASMLFAAFFMGNAGLLVSYLVAYPPHTIVLLRGIFGSFFLFLFALKTKSISRNFFYNSFKVHWKPFLIICLTYPIGMLFYFMNMTVSGYSSAVFLSYTNGIFLLMLLILSREEQVSRINIFSFSVVLVGLAIITEFWTGFFNIFGVLLGIFTGLVIAIDVFNKKKLYKKWDLKLPLEENEGNVYIFLALWQHLFSVFFFLPIGFLDLGHLTITDLIFSVLLGLGPSALGFMLFNYGIKSDKGGNVFILSYLEPVVATINAALFLQEFSIYTVIGGAFILTGSYIVTKYSKN